MLPFFTLFIYAKPHQSLFWWSLVTRATIFLIPERVKHGPLCTHLILLPFQTLLASQTHINWAKVPILRDSHLLTAALLAETSSTVTAVMSFFRGKGAAEFNLTIVAVKSQVSWYPNRRLPRLILRHWYYLSHFWAVWPTRVSDRSVAIHSTPTLRRSHLGEGSTRQHGVGAVQSAERQRLRSLDRVLSAVVKRQETVFKGPV